MRSIITLFIVLFSTLTFAIAPSVTSITPLSHSIDAPKDGVIEVQFDVALDPSTIDHNSFRIFGRWSGPANGTISIVASETKIVFTPNEDFFAGEWVTVNLSKNIKSATGDNIDHPYCWNFWIATEPGILDQPVLDVIELRQPGEGLIQTYGAYAGDLNNDGSSDFMVINENSDDYRVLLNDGSGGFPTMSTTNMGSGFPSPNEGADFNNDGNIDMAVVAMIDNQVRILMGSGFGTFGAMVSYDVGAQPRGISVIDFNGDGHDDIAITNRNSNNMSMLTNDGTGAFTVSSIDFDTNGSGETSVVPADINNDGIQDLFIGLYTTRELAILISDGNGGFTKTDKVSVDGRPWMIAAGDVNGDGNADVVSANSFGNEVAVSFGDGLGGLSAPVDYLVNGESFPLAIDLGDLDGDGDLDMVASYYSSSSFIVFENNGSGAFSVAGTLASPMNASCAILHDRDNDGDLDISGTDEGVDVITLFDNNLTTSVTAPESIVSSFNAFPNPLSESVQLEFDLISADFITIEILDAYGKLVQQIYSGDLVEGNHKFLWEPGKTITDGIYFGTVVSSEIQQTVKIFKVGG